MGGIKSQRKLAENVVDFCIADLMPRFKTLDISVSINDISKDKVKGWCMAITSREFEIEVDSNQSHKSLIKTVCHEMVHVWQHATGMLHDNHWNGVDHSASEYIDRPWEIQAYNFETNLYKKFLSTIKKDYFSEKNC
jgi:hypothetical protein